MNRLNKLGRSGNPDRHVGEEDSSSLRILARQLLPASRVDDPWNPHKLILSVVQMGTEQLVEGLAVALCKTLHPKQRTLVAENGGQDSHSSIEHYG